MKTGEQYRLHGPLVSIASINSGSVPSAECTWRTCTLRTYI